MKKRFLCFCLCLYCIGLWAANTSFKKTGNDLLFLLPQGNVKLEFCTDDMFRVRHSQGTVFAENEQWMVRKYDFTPVHYTCPVSYTHLMTIAEWPAVFETTAPVKDRVYDKNQGRVRLPASPYLLLRITEVE